MANWKELFGIGKKQSEDIPFEPDLKDELDAKTRQRMQSAYTAAIVLQRQSRFNEAIPYYQDVLEIDESHVDSLYGLASCIAQTDRFEEAEDYLIQIVNLVPSHADAYFMLGSVYSSREDWDKALEAYERAGELGPQTSSAYLHRGYGHYMKKEYEKALECFKRAKKRNPMDDQIYHFTGSVYVDLKQYDEAEQMFRQALRLSPNNIQYIVNMGWFLIERSRQIDAEAYIRSAMTNRPNNTDLKRLLCSVYYDLDKHQESIDIGLQIIELNPHEAIAYSNVAESLIKLGRDEEAMKYFEKALAIDSEPMVGISHYGLGLFAAREGNTEEAKSQFLSCLEIESDHEGAIRGLTQIESLSKQIDSD